MWKTMNGLRKRNRMNESGWESRILYGTKNPKDRIIGYDGKNIYLFREGKILAAVEGKNFKEIGSVQYDKECDYEFSWNGSKLVLFLPESNEVVETWEVSSLDSNNWWFVWCSSWKAKE